MSIFTRTALAAALLAAAPLASAATATTTFEVSIEILNSCTIAASPMVFATQTGNIVGNIDAMSNLTVNCNDGALYSIGLNDGANGTRVMSAGGAQTVSYELYTDVGRVNRWDDLGGANTAAGTGSNADQTVTVYGRVAGPQSVAAGTYNDTITATIEF